MLIRRESWPMTTGANNVGRRFSHFLVFHLPDSLDNLKRIRIKIDQVI